MSVLREHARRGSRGIGNPSRLGATLSSPVPAAALSFVSAVLLFVATLIPYVRSGGRAFTVVDFGAPTLSWLGRVLEGWIPPIAIALGGTLLLTLNGRRATAAAGLLVGAGIAATALAVGTVMESSGSMRTLPSAQSSC